MCSKTQWGVMACVVGVVVGCQSSSPDMRLIDRSFITGPVVESPMVATTVEPVQASFQPATPAAPSRNAVVTPSNVTAYPSFTPAGPATGQPTITKADVVNWTARGVPDEVIIDRLTRGRAVFQLTAADQNELRDKGVSTPVIRTMREMWRR